MERNALTDDATKLPKLDAAGNPRSQIFIALAIPKDGRDWKVTEWGSQIYNAGVAAWPNGEHQIPTFAWKVEDGDSVIPNRNNKKNAEREGYPGHWILKASTELSVRCHHVGRYEAHEVIQDPKQIKRGDFGRLYISVKGNNYPKSAGIYVNPELFSLDRAGEEIMVVGGTSAAEAFGGSAPAVPPGAAVNPAIPAPASTPAPVASGAIPAAAPAPAAVPAPAIPPAPDFLTPPPQRMIDGQMYTQDALIASGWTIEAIQALPIN
jgi:hypothetical protein